MSVESFVQSHSQWVLRIAKLSCFIGKNWGIPRLAPHLCREQGLHKIVGGEFDQVVQLFADADKPDWDF